jgi:hypothetical protein
MSNPDNNIFGVSMPTKALILKPDMTFIEKKVRTKQNFMRLGKNDLVSFNMGKSVFRERLKITERWKLWRKRRNLIICLEGSNSAFELKYDPPKPEDPNNREDPLVWIQPSAFTKGEADEFISKLYARASAMKGVKDWRLWLIIGMLAVSILFQVGILRV